MAPIAFDYRRQSPANILRGGTQRFLWNFMAMLAVETVLNRPHCSEFFHRPWLQGWTTPKSPWDSDTVISSIMSEFNCEDLLI